MKTENGFDYTLTNWALIGQHVMIFCIVYFEGTEIVRVPGILSLREWNNGQPNSELIRQLMDNLVAAANDAALMKLGWPPYDQVIQDRKAKRASWS